MTDKARELLERAYQYIPMSSVTSQEIRDFLSTPEPTQNEEPIAWWNGITPEMSEEEFWIARCIHYGIASRKTDDCDIPLYLHPAPRPEFVRLSEKEILANDEIMSINAEAGLSMYLISKLARAIEDALIEKNK